MKSNFYCCPYLENIIQSYVSKTLPCCSQNIGCFLYLVLLISLNLGIFHQSIFFLFTHFFKLFLRIFKFPNISMEKGNTDNKLIQSTKKYLKLHQSDQAHDSYSWFLFHILYSPIHAWVKWKSTNYHRSFLSFFSKERTKLKCNWTHAYWRKALSLKLKQLQHVIRSLTHPIATFLQLDRKSQWFGVIFDKAFQILTNTLLSLWVAIYRKDVSPTHSNQTS